jgi:hypothetical protein
LAAELTLAAYVGTEGAEMSLSDSSGGRRHIAE